MLNNLKNLVKNHRFETVLSLSIVLIALTSFGLGRLTAPTSYHEPIIIKQPASLANPSIIEEKSLGFKENKADLSNNQGRFVGSLKSNKYHWPDCPWAKKISPENQIWFNSEQEAQEAGYLRCGNFDKYSP